MNLGRLFDPKMLSASKLRLKMACFLAISKFDKKMFQKSLLTELNVMKEFQIEIFIGKSAEKLQLI